MKVIGTTSRSQYDTGDYLCIVSHTELEQYLGMYYATPRLDRLHVGQELDLSKAYHFASKITSAVSKVEELVKNHQEAINSIMQGMNLLAIQAAAERERAEKPVISGDSGH